MYSKPLVISVLCCTEGRQNVNVALKRPAWQSSVTYCSGTNMCGAHTVNDGDLNTLYGVYPGCAHSLLDLYPWWAVDLGVSLYVDGVNVTSRGQCCGMYFPCRNRCRILGEGGCLYHAPLAKLDVYMQI